MQETQKVGGIAALVEAATYLFGIALFATVLSDYTSGDLSDGESVAFIADHQGIMYAWNLVIYVVASIALVVLALALYSRLKGRSPFLAQIGAAFGLIWAALIAGAGMVANIGLGTVVDLLETDPERAESVWLSLEAVENGLGGGNEILGSVWVLVISWAALRTGVLPRTLNYLGALIALAGLATIIPALEAMGMVFGLGFIAWFVLVGVIMLRHPTVDLPTAADRSDEVMVSAF